MDVLFLYFCTGILIGGVICFIFNVFIWIFGKGKDEIKGGTVAWVMLACGALFTVVEALMMALYYEAIHP